MQLYNTMSADERAKLIEEAGLRRLTLSFYAYAHISDPQQFRMNCLSGGASWMYLGVSMWRTKGSMRSYPCPLVISIYLKSIFTPTLLSMG